MSPVKEPAYFASASDGADWVRTRAEYERLFEGATTQRARGEASPQYLNDEAAPDRIAADLPGVRLIVSLRNPVDRAYSSYLGRLAFGNERRGVVEALRRDTYYFESSLYHASLSRYFARFERDRISVLLFDDLVGDTARHDLKQVCDFRNVRSGSSRARFVRSASRRNRGSRPVSPAENGGVLGTWRTRFAAISRRAQLEHRSGEPACTAVARPPPRLPLPSAIRQRLQADFRDDILPHVERADRPARSPAGST
jgi:hypothetical protein